MIPCDRFRKPFAIPVFSSVQCSYILLSYYLFSHVVAIDLFIFTWIHIHIAGGSSVYSCTLVSWIWVKRLNAWTMICCSPNWIILLFGEQHELVTDNNELVTDNNIPTHFVRKFKSVYAQTAVKVRVNESFSDSWRICRGVRQGGITSAFLFNIYIYIYRRYPVKYIKF